MSHEDIINILVVIITTIVAPQLLKWRKDLDEMRKEERKACAAAHKELADLQGEWRLLNQYADDVALLVKDILTAGYVVTASDVRDINRQLAQRPKVDTQ